jgi:hypothetical protein
MVDCQPAADEDQKQSERLRLHWPLLDADLYVPGLIEGALGLHRWMRQIGKLGGSRRSSAKAKAFRENGKRGGRPKESEAA